MREFRDKKEETSFWKKVLKGLINFFSWNSHSGTLGDHDNRMRKRRRKTKFHK